MFNPNQNAGGGSSVRMTKVSTGICIATAVVTFFGILPRFAPYAVIMPYKILFPFPKPWVLFTGMFNSGTFFQAVMNCVFTILIGRSLEPLWGSKEFLRIYIMSGLYTSILVLIYAYIMIFITGYKIIGERVFYTNSAPTGSILMCFAIQLRKIVIPTQYLTIKVRLIPFYSFLFILLISLFSTMDSLLCTMISFTLAYIYMKYIKLHDNGQRGDEQLDLYDMLPTWCHGNENVEEVNPEEIARQAAAAQGGGDDEAPYQPHQLNADHAPRRPPSNNNTTQPRNTFQGRPHTIG